jgi:hypothetical protein
MNKRYKRIKNKYEGKRRVQGGRLISIQLKVLQLINDNERILERNEDDYLQRGFMNQNEQKISLILAVKVNLK